MNYYDLELPKIDDCLYIFNDFMNHQIIRKLSDSSILSLSKEALNLFSILSPKDINQSYINSYMLDYGDISPALRNKKNSALRTILKYLFKEGYSNCNLKIHYVKQSKKLPDYISELDMLKIVKQYQKKIHTNTSIWKGRRDYALLLFMYATGLRASEIVNFKITDLDKNWIRVENGKGQKDRYVPIAAKAVKALYDYLKYLPMHIKVKNTPLFVSDLLVPFTRLTLYNYTKNTFGYNPHFFRHTFATHLITNGCSEYVLMDIMGHSSLSTTQIYTHIQKKHLQNTVINYFPPMS